MDGTGRVHSGATHSTPTTEHATDAPLHSEGGTARGTHNAPQFGMVGDSLEVIRRGGRQHGAVRGGRPDGAVRAGVTGPLEVIRGHVDLVISRYPPGGSSPYVQANPGEVLRRNCDAVFVRGNVPGDDPDLLRRLRAASVESGTPSYALTDGTRVYLTENTITVRTDEITIARPEAHIRIEDMSVRVAR